MSEKTVVVDIGGVWESDAWEIQYNCTHDAYRSKYNRMVSSVPGGQWSPWSSEPCPHAVQITYDEMKHYPVGSYRNEESWEESRNWIVPRVVVAYNEAGHSNTGVCLDCILDWGSNCV